MLKQKIDQANEAAVNKMIHAQPVWVDVKPAYKVINKMTKNKILHAGPPISWNDMCGPMRGAIVAALKYEGLARSNEEAEEIAASGQISFEPCHHYQAVGPMTGIISYSMPLIVVENQTDRNYAYSTINEGMGDVLRFGAYSDAAVERLRWIENVLASALKAMVNAVGGINLKVLIAQALTMGDELHMRNNASTTVFIKTIVSTLAEVVEDRTQLKEIIRFLTTNNDQFFLNFAMAANKATADAAHNVPNSSIVTTIARNGYEIGIRVSGLGNQWFTAPAQPVKGLYFSGFSEKDANPDIGDSAIMETVGLGGFAIATAPAIVKFLGAGTYQDAINYTMDMYEISVAENQSYPMPNLDFRGTPIGIDIRKVVETGITPIINTAIASNQPGVGMIGAGIANAPFQLFEKALYALADKLAINI